MRSVGFVRKPDHDRIGVRRRLVRTGRDVQAAEDHGDTARPVAIGQGVGVVDARGETRRGDDVEVAECCQRALVLRQRVDLDVRHVELARRHAGERQEPEARQRRDGAPALDETRQREAEGEQLRVDDAHAAHGDESEAQCHRESGARRVTTAAA